MPWKVKSEKTLDFSKKIIAGKGNLAQVERGLTIEKSLSQPTLNTVFSGNNGSIGFAVVKVLVTRFLDSFGFSNKPSDTQIEMITVDTLDSFGYESLVDVILFFKMARSGKFGETQRGVDSNLIFGKWFPIYLDKKAEIREKKHQEFKETQKVKNTVSLEQVENTYKKALLKKLTEKRQEFVVDFTKSMDRQMLEDTINHWDKDKELKNYVTMLKMQRRVIKN